MREEMAATAERKQEAVEAVREVVEAEQRPDSTPEPTIMPPVVVERTEDAEPPKQYSTTPVPMLPQARPVNPAKPV